MRSPEGFRQLLDCEFCRKRDCVCAPPGGGEMVGRITPPDIKLKPVRPGT